YRMARPGWEDIAHGIATRSVRQAAVPLARGARGVAPGQGGDARRRGPAAQRRVPQGRAYQQLRRADADDGALRHQPRPVEHQRHPEDLPARRRAARHRQTAPLRRPGATRPDPATLALSADASVKLAFKGKSQFVLKTPTLAGGSIQNLLEIA